MASEEYLGKGIVFPFELTNGGLKVTTGMPLLEASIYHILSWPLHTRYFLKSFGTRIFELLGEPNETVLRGLVKRFLVDSILQFERRIDILDVFFDYPKDSHLDIIVLYEIKKTREQKQVVIPLYT